jgi:tripartite-type tricarboxylate transporter receptor subunit TctC
MFTSRFTATTFLVGLMALDAATICAQNFPNKPIRIIASEAGGLGDVAARMITPALSAAMGQQVIVDNRGGGVIAGEIVSKSPADGYTLLLYGNTLWLLHLMRDHVPYDTLKDFAPITVATRGQNVLVVNPSLPVKSVKELIAMAKARPGELDYASAAAGTGNHLAAELFKFLANVNIMRIPHKGTQSALTSVVSGQVHLMFATSSAVPPHLKSGRLRALAVTGAQPSALFPDLPTISAAGVPGYDSTSSHAIFAPAGTPLPVINRLNQEIVGTLAKPEIKERLANVGIDIVGSTPEQLSAAMKAEITSMGKVIKAANIRDQ